MIAQLDRTEDATARRAGETGRLGNVALVLAAAAAFCGLLGGRLVDSAEVDGLGLLGALPALYWAGAALGVGATFLLLRAAAARGGGGYAVAVPMLWLVLLHLGPHLAHAHPRYPTAWTHVGLLRVIDETGTGDLVVDPRLGWPGMHAVFMAPLAGLDSRLLESLLRVWPAFITGTTAVLVAALARRSYPTLPLIGSLSALWYVLLAWMGHDYFSPESVGLLWFIGVVVLLESGPLEIGSAWSGMVPILARFSASGGDRPASRSSPAFVALIVLSLGAIVSHPVAPLFICLALLILGFYGRSLAWRLLLVVGLAYVVWYLVFSRTGWGNGPGELTRPFAGLFDDTATELTGSTTGASSNHRVVVWARLFATLATIGSVLAIGLAMAGERRRHLRPAVPLVPLVVVPVMVVALGGFNGAPMIRALWFTLPFASILAARILVSLPAWNLPVTGAVAVAALCPLLLLTRFGGERFEFTTEPDRAAVEAAYDSADDDTLFVADSAFVPWLDKGVGRNAFAVHPVEATEGWLDDVEAEAVRAGKDRILVVLTDGQVGWSVHGRGQPAGTLDAFAEWLLERPDAQLLFAEQRSWVIEL